MCDKPTWVIGLVQNGHGETRGLYPLRLDNSSLDPGCIPQVSRRTVRPYAQRQTEPRNGVTPPPALRWHGTRVSPSGAGVNRKRMGRGIVSEANAHGKA